MIYRTLDILCLWRSQQVYYLYLLLKFWNNIEANLLDLAWRRLDTSLIFGMFWCREIMYMEMAGMMLQLHNPPCWLEFASIVNLQCTWVFRLRRTLVIELRCALVIEDENFPVLLQFYKKITLCSISVNILKTYAHLKAAYRSSWFKGVFRSLVVGIIYGLLPRKSNSATVRIILQRLWNNLIWASDLLIEIFWFWYYVVDFSS